MIVSVTRAVPILFAEDMLYTREFSNQIHVAGPTPVSSDNHTLFTMSKIEEPSGFHRRRSPYPSQCSKLVRKRTQGNSCFTDPILFACLVLNRVRGGGDRD
jgi:hypothetical protein